MPFCWGLDAGDVTGSSVDLSVFVVVCTHGGGYVISSVTCSMTCMFSSQVMHRHVPDVVRTPNYGRGNWWSYVFERVGKAVR